MATTTTTDIINIDDTEIILRDYGHGKGKIIIANPYNLNFSYYWSAMGSSLKEFLKSLDYGYFINKLTNKTHVFSGKNTAKNIRKYIRQELKYDLPWYKHMEFQKSLRRWIKEIEEMETTDEFVHYAISIADSCDLDFSEMSYYEKKDIQQLLTDTIGCEPWHMAGDEPSRETLFLGDLFKKLKIKLENYEHK